MQNYQRFYINIYLGRIRIGTHPCLPEVQEMHVYHIAPPQKFRIQKYFKIVVLQTVAFPCTVWEMVLWIFLLIFFVTNNTLNSDSVTSSYSISFVIIKRPSYIIIPRKQYIKNINAVCLRNTKCLHKDRREEQWKSQIF